MKIVDMVSFTIGGNRADHLLSLAKERNLGVAALGMPSTHLLFVCHQQSPEQDCKWVLFASGSIQDLFTKVYSLAGKLALGEYSYYDENGHFANHVNDESDLSLINMAKDAIRKPLPLVMLPCLAPWITITRQNFNGLNEHFLPYPLKPYPVGVNYALDVTDVDSLLALWLFSSDIQMSAKPVLASTFKVSLDDWRNGDINPSCNFNDTMEDYFEPADIVF